MNRSWIALVAIGVIAVVIIVGWDVIMTVTGNKSDFAYNIVPINNALFGNLENHLQTDQYYYIYQQQAAAEQSSSSGGTQTTL